MDRKNLAQRSTQLHSQCKHLVAYIQQAEAVSQTQASLDRVLRQTCWPGATSEGPTDGPHWSTLTGVAQALLERTANLSQALAGPDDLYQPIEQVRQEYADYASRIHTAWPIQPDSLLIRALQKTCRQIFDLVWDTSDQYWHDQVHTLVKNL